MGMPGHVPPMPKAVDNDRKRIEFLRAELAKPLSPARRRMVLQALREAEQAAGVPQ